MRLATLCLFSLLHLVALAQSPRCTIATVRSSQKEPNAPNTWLVDAIIKVTVGSLRGERQAMEVALPNGDKIYIDAELFTDLKTGQTAQAILTCYNGEPKPGQSIAPRGTSPIKAPANRSFEGVISQAFLGAEKDEFAVVLKQFTGHLLPRDVLQAVGPKGERCQATVQSLDRRSPYAVEMLSGGMTDVMVMVKTAGCVLSENYKLTLSGAKTMAAEAPPTATSKAFVGKRTLHPVNAVLKDNGLTITVNHVVQYFPKDGLMLKVDPNLNYYILDVSVENTSGQVIDPGDYLLRLNFFDAKGNSADEFGRIFKNEKNKPDDVNRGADALDKSVFGGSSAIRFAGVAASYTGDLPNFDNKTCDATWATLKPGQKARCEALKAIGVPKSYQPVAVGTWKDDRRKLLTTPIALK